MIRSTVMRSRRPPAAARLVAPAARTERCRLVDASAFVAWMTVWLALATAPGGAEAQSGGGTDGGFRRLAPGALTVIPPFQAALDTAPRYDLLDVTVGHRDLAWQPHQAAAETTFVALGADVEFPRDIWCLEFAFKPPRSIDVDVPTDELRMRRTRVWYLVYRVRNVGGRRTVTAPNEPADREMRAFESAIRFRPQFVLESRQPLDRQEGVVAYRSYLDRVMPSAVAAIRRREDPGLEFLDSSSIAATDIPPGESRWGIATWEAIDPRIKFFSIYVRGLTNALAWRPRAGVRLDPDTLPCSSLDETLKALRLDFWRPGDDRNESDERLHVGFMGMFERMALGGRLLEDLGQPELHHSNPAAALERLGLAWTDLLDPVIDDDPAAPDWTRLGPLATILSRVAAEADPEVRFETVEQLFGDIGSGYLAELLDAVQAAGRGTAPETARLLGRIDLAPDSLSGDPLAAVARLAVALDPLTPGDRSRLLDALVGPAGKRLDWLAREAASGRTIATLAALDVPASKLLAGDARAALETVRPVIDAQPDPDSRRDVLRGLFGPRGPDMYATAVEVNEGIDHAWVFRYEQ